MIWEANTIWMGYKTSFLQMKYKRIKKSKKKNEIEIYKRKEKKTYERGSITGRKERKAIINKRKKQTNNQNEV